MLFNVLLFANNLLQEVVNKAAAVWGVEIKKIEM